MRTRYLPAAALAVANSAIQLLGVLVWGWPIGNVLLLLWVENVLITLAAIIRVMSVVPEPGESLAGSKASASFGLFFFTLVHGVFSVVLGFIAGLDLSMTWFVWPVVILIVRYVVEAVTTFSRVPRPRTVEAAHGFAMGRILMLHLAIIASGGVMVIGFGQAHRDRTNAAEVLPVIALAVVLVIKTIADVMSLGRDPNRESSFKFNSGSD